jgi:hypothetical protein
MKIPSKVKVGGFTYKVIKNYKFKEDSTLCGQTDNSLLEVRISYIDISGEKRKEEKIEEIFLHEILHLVNQIYNANKLDEETVTRLTMGLYQVLKDNRGILI